MALSVGAAERTTLRVGIVGDIYPAGSGEAIFGGRPPTYPFEGVRPLINRCDVFLGNLETTITPVTKAHGRKKYHFRVGPDRVALLKAGGFHGLFLANNHVFDFGVEGFLDTVTAVREAGITPVGGGPDEEAAYAPALFDVNGVTLAVVAFTPHQPERHWAKGARPGVAGASPARVAEAVRNARLQGQAVVAAFHWGEEYRHEPNGAQRALARVAVDAGADLVVGHHPHTPQGLEWVRGAVVAYSVGNFVFGSRNPKAEHALFLEATFSTAGGARRATFDEVRAYPLWVRNRAVEFQPRPLKGREAGPVLHDLRRWSRALHTDLTLSADSAQVIPGRYAPVKSASPPLRKPAPPKQSRPLKRPERRP